MLERYAPVVQAPVFKIRLSESRDVSRYWHKTRDSLIAKSRATEIFASEKS